MLLKILHFVAWYIGLHLALLIGILLVAKLLRQRQSSRPRLLLGRGHSAVS